MTSSFRKPFFYFTATVLICALVVILYRPTPRAEAFAVVCVNCTNEVTNLPLLTTISGATVDTAANTTVTAAADTKLTIKEYILDTLVWQLINMVIHKMSQDIVSWINSGFAGSPAFVTDFSGFMTTIGDKMVGDMITGTSLNVLCSPFRLKVKATVGIQHGQLRDFNPKCTLSGVVRNMDSFLNGNFSQGGWNGWYSMTQLPQNNPYGAGFLVTNELNVSISNAQGKQLNLLSWGKGFLSKQKCQRIDTREVCETVTPGTAIESQLNNTLAAGQQRLIVANEFNQIVSALLGQLVSSAFRGVGGLLGLTQPAYSGGAANYYGGIKAEQDQINGSTNTAGTHPIDDSIASENSYLGFQTQIVTMLTAAQNYKNLIYGAADMCSNGALTATLATALNDAQNAVTASNNTIDTLTLFNAQYTGTTDPVQRNSIMTKYQGMVAGNEIHTTVDAQHVQRGIPNLQTQIDQFKSSIDAQCMNNGGGGGAGAGAGP